MVKIITMIPRSFESIVFNPTWGRQMRFLAGPRQCGKTSLARQWLARHHSQDYYFNWDSEITRDHFRRNRLYFYEMISQIRLEHPKGALPWICFDEIHKIPKWKNILKGIFDEFERKVNFLVTGSARLDLFRKAGDSLVGRYFLFRLFPFGFEEITRRESFLLASPPHSAAPFIESILDSSMGQKYTTEFLSFLEFGGFPEPFLKGRKDFHSRWQRDYLDRLVREDLRDLTRIADLEKVAQMVVLLPTKIGSPLSLNSLTEDLEVSHSAIRSWIAALNLTYTIFKVPPYAKKITRTLRKEAKWYFFDWSRNTSEGALFENYVAVELYRLCSGWQDAGYGDFELRFVRTQDNVESDFLILRDERPWLLLECKLGDQAVERHHLKHAHLLGNIPVVQLIKERNIARQHPSKAWSISAERFFG